MLRILTILGTRPEAIKLAPVIDRLRAYRHCCTSLVCVTSQHREMLTPVLQFFEIQAQYDLDVMTRGHSLTDVTTRVLRRLEPVIRNSDPDVLLVQGDTTTALAAALAAFYQKRKIGHVEAGLRTGDKYGPFPEEMNRRLIASLADYHFSPTEGAKDHLLREGVSPARIVVTGNTGIDALFMTMKTAQASAKRCPRLDSLEERLVGQRIILVTAHRRENFGLNIKAICRALLTVAALNPDVHVVYPVHLNPNIRGPVVELLEGHQRITVMDPLDYPAFVQLLARSYLILTDSGGIQEEAPSLGKPVLVLRECTERPEAIQAGTARLVGTNTDSIVANVQRLLHDQNEYDTMSRVQNPFGDGHASQRIVERILSDFGIPDTVTLDRAQNRNPHIRTHFTQIAGSLEPILRDRPTR